MIAEEYDCRCVSAGSNCSNYFLETKSMNKVEVEIFSEEPDVLKAKTCILLELLPLKIKFVVSESLIAYPTDIDYSNCSPLEILKKERNRLNDNRHYRKRTVSAEGEIEEGEFVSLLEKAGFSVFRKLNS